MVRVLAWDDFFLMFKASFDCPKIIFLNETIRKNSVEFTAGGVDISKDFLKEFLHCNLRNSIGIVWYDR